MTDTSCSGPDCTYTGPQSGAEHGKCTETGGYIANGEIKALMAEGRVSKQWTDDTQSDYVIFGGEYKYVLVKRQSETNLCRHMGCIHERLQQAGAQ